jgi:hypothetical protein
MRYRILIAADEWDGEQGFRARCSCSWASPFQGLTSSIELLIAAHRWLKHRQGE